MKNILILIDMQKGFTLSENTACLKQKIEELLKNRIFDIVIATRFLNEYNSVFEQLLSWKKFKSEPERELIENIEPYIDYIEDKYIYSCVNTNFIQKICQMNDGRYPEQIFLAGVDTDSCVMATAIDLFENNIRPIVLTDYCASNGGEEVHRAAITCMRRLIGIRQLQEGIINERSDLDNKMSNNPTG